MRVAIRYYESVLEYKIFGIINPDESPRPVAQVPYIILSIIPAIFNHHVTLSDASNEGLRVELVVLFTILTG